MSRMVPFQKILVTGYKGHLLHGNEGSGNSIGPLSRPWKGGVVLVSHIPKTNMANIPKIQKAFCPHIP